MRQTEEQEREWSEREWRQRQSGAETETEWSKQDRGVRGRERSERDRGATETVEQEREREPINWYCKYCKVKYMNDKRRPFKLLSNEWVKVKCKGHHK